MGTLVQSEDFSPFVLSSTRKLDFNLMEQDKTMQVCMLVPAKKKCL
jgi:membrane glycosyltransferase